MNTIHLIIPIYDALIVIYYLLCQGTMNHDASPLHHEAVTLANQELLPSSAAEVSTYMIQFSFHYSMHKTHPICEFLIVIYLLFQGTMNVALLHDEAMILASQELSPTPAAKVRACLI